MSKTVEFCGEIKRKTDKAYLIYDGNNEFWIPRSQIIDFTELKSLNIFEFTIPMWLAIEKEII